MTCIVDIHITHKVCPENEEVSDEDLINWTLEYLIDDPEGFRRAFTTTFEAKVERT